MKPERPAADTALLKDPGDYSFILGGPLYQLLRRAHLAGDDLELARQRLLVLMALAWLPLLILSAAQGLALGANVAVPFLRDIEANVRFLLVVPLLIAAEITVHKSLRSVARQFVERELIPARSRTQFEDAIVTSMRLRDSIPAELALVAVVYVVGIQVLWRHYTSLDVATWYATPSPAGKTLTLAGLWYVYVSLPFCQFLLLRWYYRIAIWTRFLWKVSRINLRLVATSPDRVGGLGFLTLTPFAFAPLAVAHGAQLSAFIANRIFLHEAGLLDFKGPIIGVVVLMLLLVFVPLLVFSPQLTHAWRQGVIDYGALAERYAHEFDAKWIGGGRPTGEPMLGSSDFQSFADMDNVYSVVRSIQLAPITRPAVIQVLLATLAPIAPLVLTLIPLGELLQRLLRVVF